MSKIHRFLLRFQFYSKESEAQIHLERTLTHNKNEKEEITNILLDLNIKVFQIKSNQAELLNSYPQLNTIENVFNLMVSICGGKESYEQLPELTITDRHYSSPFEDYVDNISPKDMTAFVMRFKELHQRPGIAIRARKGYASAKVQTFFQRYTHQATWADGVSKIIPINGRLINCGVIQKKELKKLHQLITTDYVDEVRLA